MHRTDSLPDAFPNGFQAARRVNKSFTAHLESQLLRWIALRLPSCVTSDQLTLLGLLAQCGAGLGYTFAGRHRALLWAVIVCILLNWFGDSLDGTLARVRGQGRPRFGFYVDHVIDLLGSVALMTGLALSGLVHASVAMAMLLGFLLLAGESYLATYTLSAFEMSQGLFGPTEIRVLLIIGNLALLRNPFCTIFGRHLLLFDLGGTIAAGGMGMMFLLTALRHTRDLYRQEPLPQLAGGDV